MIINRISHQIKDINNKSNINKIITNNNDQSKLILFKKSLYMYHKLKKSKKFVNVKNLNKNLIGFRLAVVKINVRDVVSK